MSNGMSLRQYHSLTDEEKENVGDVEIVWPVSDVTWLMDFYGIEYKSAKERFKDIEKMKNLGDSVTYRLPTEDDDE